MMCIVSFRCHVVHQGTCHMQQNVRLIALRLSEDVVSSPHGADSVLTVQ